MSEGASHHDSYVSWGVFTYRTSKVIQTHRGLALRNRLRSGNQVIGASEQTVITSVYGYRESVGVERDQHAIDALLRKFAFRGRRGKATL